MLSLRGVPLSKVPSFGSADSESPAYAASQSAFIAARGDGTPLLPGAVGAEVQGPPPYVRVVLTAMLLRHVAGDDPSPAGEDEMRAAAVAHLALIEVLASEVSSPASSTEEVVLPKVADKVAFGVKLVATPTWLQDVVLRSLIRGETAGSPPRTEISAVAAAAGDTSDPVVRLASESALWMAVSPHGEVEANRSAGRITSMATAVASGRLEVPEAEVSVVATPSPGDPWLDTAVSSIAGLVDDLTSAAPPSPSEDALRLAILRRVTSSESSATGTPAFVVTAETVSEFLSTYDAMRSYVLQHV